MSLCAIFYSDTLYIWNFVWIYQIVSPSDIEFLCWLWLCKVIFMSKQTLNILGIWSSWGYDNRIHSTISHKSDTIVFLSLWTPWWLYNFTNIFERLASHQNSIEFCWQLKGVMRTSLIVLHKTVQSRKGLEIWAHRSHIQNCQYFGK